MRLIDGKAHALRSNELLKGMIQDKAKNRSPKLVIISVGFYSFPWCPEIEDLAADDWEYA